ncbi:MAG: hypothetical protein IJT46_02915 [Bacteroidaceae bacterium]|nr:hypothetical protein [Bacteroidaceae bacterium]
MEKYYRMVIDLYKEAYTDLKDGRNPDNDRILEVKKALACAVTEARVKEEPYDRLNELIKDISVL